jgi:hypothetical protein
MRELTFTKAAELLSAIDNDEAGAIAEAVAKTTARIRRQHEKYRVTVLSKIPHELRALAVKKARESQRVTEDVPAMPSHEIDDALSASPEVPERLREPLTDARLSVGKGPR